MSKSVSNTTINTTAVTPIIYAPREMSMLEQYEGLIIVVGIVFVYFTSLCCVTVYLQRKRNMLLRKLEENASNVVDDG